MKYVAFLRAINVGGNTMIKMADLKAAFEKVGFTNVSTYINSGNVIFESTGKNTAKIIEILERELSKEFNYNLLVVVRSHDELKKIASEIPKPWENSTTLRRYIAFLKDDVLNEETIAQVPVREGIDELKTSKNVLYMTTVLDEKTKSYYTKMVGKPIYKLMTLRDYKTLVKVLALMEK